MKIFSTHRKKMEPRKRFGSMNFRKKLKTAANYKRAFNPTSVFSLKILPSRGKFVSTAIVVSIIILLIGVSYLFISSKFLITQITVSGNNQVSTQQISDALTNNANSGFSLFKKNNFFLMTKGRVSQLLTSNIPTIKDVVSYSRTWPNKATIQISEHTPGFVIESDSKYFLIDDEGTVVSQIGDPQKLLVVQDQLVEDFAQGEILANDKLTPFILSMYKLWSTKISVPIASVKFPGKAGNDVQFVTATGWGVLFDTTRPVSVQLSDLAVMLSSQIKPADQANLAYIDLRLSKWAYYCFKATPCQQDTPTPAPVDAGAQTNPQPNVQQ